MAGLSGAIWDEANIPTHLGFLRASPIQPSSNQMHGQRRADLLCSEATCCGSMPFLLTQSQLYPTILCGEWLAGQSLPQNMGLSKAGSAWLSHGCPQLRGEGRCADHTTYMDFLNGLKWTSHTSRFSY